MTERYFVDTNLLVYTRDNTEPDKHERATAWMKWLWEHEAGFLSTQVLNEYYQVVTRRLDPGLDKAVARDDIADLMVWEPLPLTGDLVHRAWEIEDRYQLSWWDSLIVAAAHALQCPILLSEDLQHGQDLSGVLVCNPFITPIPQDQ